MLTSSIVPSSLNPDIARREYVLNILLLSTIFLACLASILTWIKALSQQEALTKALQVSAITFVFIGIYILSRKNKSRIVAIVLILFYLFVTMNSSIQWGSDVPQNLITYALIIVMTGILISSRASFILTTIISVFLIVFWYLQQQNLVIVDKSWRQTPENFVDSFVYAITLFLIALVSWLFNQQMEHALKRARASEAALRKERDLLEQKVAKRTQELERLQKDQIAQIYRFAAIGKLASGLFHDLVNPLTLVSYNLRELTTQKDNLSKRVSDTQTLLNNALEGTKRLERFIEAVRKQIQNDSVRKSFSLNDEIGQSVQLFHHLAEEAGVKISFHATQRFSSYGNPVRFSQLANNLLSNAIDAYHKSRKKNKRIEITLERRNGFVQFSIQDWGSGIEKRHLSKIFDPLFTTKRAGGTGIGLSICKDIAEKDLKGKITVESTKRVGSTFIVTFPMKRRKKKED